ncbi:MAG: RagB/SusD family nutrient uptake outer membrane protein, partial [Rikenellaceae bacterium]
YQSGDISGNSENIKHYIGEMYFLRAWNYFKRLQTLGDFPIITTVLPDESNALIKASQRAPRNMVARFIIDDLNKAIELLKTSAPGGTNRISKAVAHLFKSRVALYEGTWLKNFKGTAFVPRGEGWPGAAKNYNNGFSINIDNEIDWFLSEAMSAASEVANQTPLTPRDPSHDFTTSASNPYYDMFSDTNMSRYGEVLLWKEYNLAYQIMHSSNMYLQRNGGNTGYTRSFVESVLMTNGLPIYASASGYSESQDDYVQSVKNNRDSRLQLFMKAPGETVSYAKGDIHEKKEGYPDIIGAQETRYVTGYAIKKGMNFNPDQSQTGKTTVGAIIFRASEAYLNYIEACYEKTGAIDAVAARYWKALRQRAGVDEDFQRTINATNMHIEAQDDLGAYSAGRIIDPTLFNIRRERRVELMAEGFRYDDLRRWRSLDQLSSSKHIVEGMKVWGVMQQWYGDKLITSGATPNVSPSENSEYLRPYQIIKNNNLAYDGYSWTPAHYLSPIAIEHFLLTASSTSDLNSSPIYQNPRWGLNAGEGAR